MHHVWLSYADWYLYWGILFRFVWNEFEIIIISIQLRTVISICQNQKQTNLRLRKIDLFHIFLHDKVIKIGIQFPKWFERKVVNIWSTFSQWRIIRPHPNPKIGGGYERGFPSPIEGVQGASPDKSLKKGSNLVVSEVYLNWIYKGFSQCQ